VRNFAQPSSLEGLALGTMLLALLGNALMVPRALHTRDLVWFAGSTWACTAGWGQLLSMALGVSAATGWVRRGAAKRKAERRVGLRPWHLACSGV
jgi:hypothetical protein